MTMLELVLEARKEEFKNCNQDFFKNGYLNIRNLEIVSSFDEEVMFILKDRVVARCNCDVLVDLMEGHIETVITDNYMA